MQKIKEEVDYVNTISNNEVENMLKDIKCQAEEIQKYLKSLPKGKNDFLLEELIGYVGGFTEYVPTIAEYIVKLEQDIEERNYNDGQYENS